MLKKKSTKQFQRRRAETPSFDAGIISEPLISFGGRHNHVDPKMGLSLYGPYTISGQKRPDLSSIIVGIVGIPNMIADAERWLMECQGIITNDGSQPFSNPHFPGFNTDFPFQCELLFGDTWQESISTQEMEKVLAEPNFYLRVKEVVNLFIKSIDILSKREPNPNVILCCINQDIIDLCTVKRNKTGELKRRKLSKSEKKALKEVYSGQSFLFPELDPTLGIEDQEEVHENLRRGLKAEAMQFGIPTQLVWPRTLNLTENSQGNYSAEDPATRAWNFTTAIYHKAGGCTWRLAEIEQDVCFVGISFYKEIGQQASQIRTSMAQAFTSAGDGYVLRGNSFEWDESRGRSPHMDANSASSLMKGVLELYQRQNRGSLPNKVVVHKTSKYLEDELSGFNDACSLVPRKDFVAFGKRDIQFYRSSGMYPPLRGSYIKFNETDLLLYTMGYIPFLRTYPGARVPKPLEIIEHFGDSSWLTVLQEILALSKMNWNTANFACSLPITIAFSKRVGHVLAELPEHLPMRSEYRFYM